MPHFTLQHSSHLDGLDIGVRTMGRGFIAGQLSILQGRSPEVRKASISRVVDVLVAVGALAAGASAWPAPLVDACPRQLAVKQSVLQDVAGWTAVNPQDSYPFARVVFFKGPPANDLRLVPTFENRNNTGLHDVWRLPKEPAGYWLACQYGNTTAEIARKLDDDIVFCRADYDARFSTLIVKNWSCLDSTAAPALPAPRPAAKAGRSTGPWHPATGVAPRVGASAPG